MVWLLGGPGDVGAALRPDLRAVSAESVLGSMEGHDATAQRLAGYPTARSSAPSPSKSPAANAPPNWPRATAAPGTPATSACHSWLPAALSPAAEPYSTLTAPAFSIVPTASPYVAAARSPDPSRRSRRSPSRTRSARGLVASRIPSLSWLHAWASATSGLQGSRRARRPASRNTSAMRGSSRVRRHRRDRGPRRQRVAEPLPLDVGCAVDHLLCEHRRRGNRQARAPHTGPRPCPRSRRRPGTPARIAMSQYPSPLKSPVVSEAPKLKCTSGAGERSDLDHR